jgi:molybdate transport system substrate-binding protein
VPKCPQQFGNVNDERKLTVCKGELAMRSLFRLALVATVIFGASFGARAQTETTLIAPGGIRAPLDDLVPRYEKKSGQKVKATYGSGGGTRKQVLSGQAFDVPVIQLPDSDVLASGQVVNSSATPLASVAVGVAVAHGAPKPDISTPEAVKRMLLSAKSISYPDPSGGAAAGVSFLATLKQLGIADQVQAKVKIGSGGADAMVKVAKGEVEIGLTYVSEMDVPGIDIVGPLPEQISPPTRLEGFISAHAKDPAAAKALLDYLSSPEAAAAYRAHKMEPGR